MGNRLEGKESGGRDAGEEALAIAQDRVEEGPRLEDVGMERVVWEDVGTNERWGVESPRCGG